MNDMPVKNPLVYSRLNSWSPHLHSPSFSWEMMKKTTVKAAHTRVASIRKRNRYIIPCKERIKAFR